MKWTPRNSKAAEEKQEASTAQVHNRPVSSMAIPTFLGLPVPVRLCLCRLMHTPPQPGKEEENELQENNEASREEDATGIKGGSPKRNPCRRHGWQAGQIWPMRAPHSWPSWFLSQRRTATPIQPGDGGDGGGWTSKTVGQVEPALGRRPGTIARKGRAWNWLRR